MEYTVTWIIDIDADTPEEAAALALTIQKQQFSLATIFDVVSADGRVTQVELTDDQS